MRKLLILGLLLVACSSNKDATATAKDGSNGSDGKNASCSTTQTATGAKISCSDGTTSVLTNGINGLNIAGPRGDRGEVGEAGVGTQGPAGISGQNGKNSLIKVYVATPAQCANGGLVIDTFTDVNGNNTYDTGDTNYQRSLLCNAVVTVTTIETQDEHHEKYHHNHNHDKSKDGDCESGKLGD
jgi:hypothetical protein